MVFKPNEEAKDKLESLFEELWDEAEEEAASSRPAGPAVNPPPSREWRRSASPVRRRERAYGR